MGIIFNSRTKMNSKTKIMKLKKKRKCMNITMMEPEATAFSRIYYEWMKKMLGATAISNKF